MTGRTHQIRVHLAHVGHPILGDDQYGVMGEWIGRSALHAECLSLQIRSVEEDEQTLTFRAGLPADMQAAAQALGLQLTPVSS